MKKLLTLSTLSVFSVLCGYSQSAAVRKDLTTTPATVSDDLQFTGTIDLSASTFTAPATYTLDTEWDSAAEINAATTDDDFLTLTGGGTLTGTIDASGTTLTLPSTFTLDTEWDTLAEIETAVSLDILDTTEIDTFAELDALVADQTLLNTATGYTQAAANAAFEPLGVAAADITDATADGIALITSADANPFTDADESKLDGIEALADVTDTDNVRAADAVMDDEVDADIKTLSLPASTTISAFGATLVDDVDQPTAQKTLGLKSTLVDNGVASIRGASLGLASQAQGRLATAAAPMADLYPLTMTEAEYEALTEYEPRIYNVIGVGRYFEAQCIYREPWTYDAADIHVMTTGDDSTGDGSFANPYLTISKGFDVAVAANGGTVWVHEGTYAENVSATGYFLKFGVAPISRVYIKARPDQHVVWTNVSGSYLLRFNGTNSNITFKGFTFEAASNVTNFFQATTVGGSVDDFEFIECFFNDTQTTGQSLFITADGGTSGFAVKRCNFYSPDSNLSTLFQYLDGATVIGNTFTLPGAAASSIPIRLNTSCSGTFYLSNNVINSSSGSGINQDTAFVSDAVVYCRRNRINGVDAASGAINFTGGSSGFPAEVYIDYNKVSSTGNGVRVTAYVDAGSAIGNNVTSSGDIVLGYPTDTVSTGTTENVEISKNTLYATGSGGHGLLVSQYGQNIDVTDNAVYAISGSANYALVLKGTSNTATGNLFYGGASNSIYAKAAINCTIQRNLVYQTIAGGNAIDFAAGDFDTSGTTISKNLIYVTAGSVYGFTAGDIGTGNVVDDNSIIVTDSGTWGSMFSNAITSLSDAQAQWAANYDQTDNDSNSVDY